MMVKMMGRRRGGGGGGGDTHNYYCQRQGRWKRMGDGAAGRRAGGRASSASSSRMFSIHGLSAVLDPPEMYSKRRNGRWQNEDAGRRQIARTNQAIASCACRHMTGHYVARRAYCNSIGRWKLCKTKSSRESVNETDLDFEENVRAALPVGYVILALVLTAGSQVVHSNYHIRYLNFVYFLMLSTSSQYIGSHRSLLLSDEEYQRYTIRFNESLFAPIFATIALLSLYLQMKYFPDWIENISSFFRVYFFFIGIGAIFGNSKLMLIESAKKLGPNQKSSELKVSDASGPLNVELINWNLPEWMVMDLSDGDDEDDGSRVPLKDKSDNVLSIKVIDVLCGAISVGIAYFNISSDDSFGNSTGIGDYTTNNLIACLIACDVMRLIKLNSFKTAAVFLIGLLSYDVFWVFGSTPVVGDNVMMEVATKNVYLGPSRLLFPSSQVLAPSLSGSMDRKSSENTAISKIESLQRNDGVKVFPYSLLGLGDVVVPSLFTSLMLRFDVENWKNKQQRRRQQKTSDKGENGRVMDKIEIRDEQDDSSSFGFLKKRYFIVSLICYAAGLGAATYANEVTKAGQPALLYLVPAMLGGSIAVAAFSPTSTVTNADTKIDVVRKEEKRETNIPFLQPIRQLIQFEYIDSRSESQ